MKPHRERVAIDSLSTIERAFPETSHIFMVFNVSGITVVEGDALEGRGVASGGGNGGAS